MKKIEAIVNADDIDTLRMALQCVGVSEMKITEIQGFIRPVPRKNETQKMFGYADWFVPKCKVDLCVMDEALRQTARVIFMATKTRAIVDGRLFFDEIDDGHATCVASTG